MAALNPKTDPYNLDFEGLGPRMRIDVGAMGVSMTTAAIILTVFGVCAMALLPLVMCYMSITSHSERRRWRAEEKRNAERRRIMERSWRPDERQWRKNREQLSTAPREQREHRPAAAAAAAAARRESHGRRASSSRRAESAGRSRPYVSGSESHHRAESRRLLEGEDPQARRPGGHSRGQRERRESRGHHDRRKGSRHGESSRR
ncbi:unnamed protein product [Discula destructiva]